MTSVLPIELNRQSGALRPKIFDIGINFLPFYDNGSASADGTFRRKEEGTEIAARKEEAAELRPKYNSIDDILVHPDKGSLDGLASAFYYNNPFSNSSIILLKEILDYIFIPLVSPLSASSDNYPMLSIYGQIESASAMPYPKGYFIARFHVDYSVNQDYEQQERAKAPHFSPLESIEYAQIPMFYRAGLPSYQTKLVTYTKPANDNDYRASNLNLPASKLAGIANTRQIANKDNFYLPAKRLADYPAKEGAYKLQVQAIDHTENSIEDIIGQKDADIMEMSEDKPDYAPKLLEDIVDGIADKDIDTADDLDYSDFRFESLYSFFNLAKFKSYYSDNDTELDFSNMLLEKFEFDDGNKISYGASKIEALVDNSPDDEIDDQQRRIIDSSIRYEPSNDNSAEALNRVRLHREENILVDDYKDPEQRRDNSKWKYKTKIIPEPMSLEIRLERDTQVADDYISVDSKVQISKSEISDTKTDPKQEKRYKASEVPAPKRQQELKRAPFERHIAENLEQIASDYKLETGAKNTGFVVYDMETNRYFGDNANMELPTPCINKVALAATIAYYVQHGKLDWDKEITIQKDLTIENDGFYKIKEGQKVKLRDMVDMMLSRSLDSYFNHVLYALGEGNVKEGIEKNNKFMHDLGLESIKIADVHMEGSNYNSNVAHGNDLVGLMYLLTRGDVIDGENSEMIINAMGKEEWSRFFKGPRKVTSKPDGMGIIGVIDGRYVVFIDADDFYGEKLAETAYKDNGERMTNRATPLGVKVINSLAKEVKSLYTVLCADASAEPQKAA